MVETEHQSRGGGPVRNCVVICRYSFLLGSTYGMLFAIAKGRTIIYSLANYDV